MTDEITDEITDEMTDEGYKKFRVSIQHAKGLKYHRSPFKGRINDYFIWMMHHRDEFKFKHEFKWKEMNIVNKIIQDVGKEINEHVSMGNAIDFPLGFGKLIVLKYKKKPVFDEEGNLKTHYYIDWQKTMKLWYEDPEAHKNKTLVQEISDTAIRIKHIHNNKHKDLYFLGFFPTHTMRKAISNNFKEGIIVDLPEKRYD